MLEWIKKNQRILSLIVGSLFLIGALVMFFWDTSKSTFSSEDAFAQANIARMEARNSGSTVASRSSAASHLDTFRERQEKQMRFVLIIMIIGGVGFIGYSLFKKP